jgi:predicted RNase H-like HicB family nuclease
MKYYNFSAQIERDTETGLYVGIVPNLPGAFTQASSLDQLQENLEEVIELCLDNITEIEILSLI